jgi:hypothetical protein
LAIGNDVRFILEGLVLVVLSSVLAYGIDDWRLMAFFGFLFVLQLQNKMEKLSKTIEREDRK